MKAFITGGNGDIGFAISEYLARENYIIHGIDKNIDRLKNINSIDATQIDLTDTEKILSYLNNIDNPYDMLIYAAGIREIVSITKLSLTEWKRVQDVNLTAAFIFSQHFIRLSLANHHPLNIIFISSISGLYGEPNRAAYCASKHGLIGLAKALAIELAANHIRVNVIAPGIIETDMTRSYKTSESLMKQIKNNIPLGKWGAPNHIVQSVDFIIKNDYLTGTTLVVDGGWTIGKNL